MSTLSRSHHDKNRSLQTGNIFGHAMQFGKRLLLGVVAFVSLVACLQNQALAQGEPAEQFLKQLRAAGYFDTAGLYLTRLSKYPGVDKELIQAVPLEKAQNFIEAAIVSRSGKDREKFFEDAQSELAVFLKQANHPRAPEARGQLGRLQMVRASQILAVDPDAAAKKKARESYLAASKTFDSIAEDLKGKLTKLQGIDSKKEPKKAALRKTYYGEFLDSQVKAADTLILAAKTYDDPGKGGKKILEDALGRFNTIGEKYRKFVPGVVSLVYKGDISAMLGQKDKARDFYKQMLDELEADVFREPKQKALIGTIGLNMSDKPPKYEQSIKLAAPTIESLRPNEKRTPTVQLLRLALAKAYLAKAGDSKQKPSDAKKANTLGRALLNDAKKFPGTHLVETKELLEGLGGSTKAEPLPTAEPPKSIDDALTSATTLYQAATTLQQSLDTLESQKETPELKAEKENLAKQLAESRSIATQILRHGLGMVNSKTNAQTANQVRQLLAYNLFQGKNFHDAIVVGSFLARSAPGTDMGINGSSFALSAYQELLKEIDTENNDAMLGQLSRFSEYLTKTWPDEQVTSRATGFRISMMLRKDDYDGAERLIGSMNNATEQSKFRRLLGQLLWNRSLQLRKDEKVAEADQVRTNAAGTLQAGLDAIKGGIVGEEAMKAALVLGKIYLKQDEVDKAFKVLDHPKYGPITLLPNQKPKTKGFEGDLFSTELKVLFAKMALVKDPGPLQTRAKATMVKLQKAFPGEDGKARLASTYVSLANDVRDQLDQASPAKREKLMKAFTDLLEGIAKSSKDAGTLKWVAQTMMGMGESAMQPGETKAAEGSEAAKLLAGASDIFQGLGGQDISIVYLRAKCQRLTGQYKPALDELEKILKQKPTMLDAQFEAALAYENWAGIVDKKFAERAYGSALSGARKGDDGKNVIWGWGKISKLTQRNQKFADKFFESRYHIAYCFLQIGRANKDENKKRESIKAIRGVESFDPNLGGAEQRAKFDRLLKTAQKEVGEKATGLKPLTPAPAGAAAN